MPRSTILNSCNTRNRNVSLRLRQFPSLTHFTMPIWLKSHCGVALYGLQSTTGHIRFVKKHRATSRAMLEEGKAGHLRRDAVLAAEAVGPLRAAVLVQHGVHPAPVLALLHGLLTLRNIHPKRAFANPSCSSTTAGTTKAATEFVIVCKE